MSSEQRFPQPEFETGYAAPQSIYPTVRPEFWQWADIAFLAIALVVMAWFVHRRRSRFGVYSLMLLCLFYFGFYRQGCLCPVGSIQNVTQAVFTSGFLPGWPALVIFSLPLLVSLWVGRVFCAGVCPLGALQDLVALKPMPVPALLERVLRVIPIVYLAVAVLYAATGGAYLICKYDPFVSFFRFGGPYLPIALGVGFLAIGTVVARPYCRFFCPYGVLLGLFSRLAMKPVAITPSRCTKCRLCEPSCPFGAIQVPAPPPTSLPRPFSTRAGILFLCLAGGTLLGFLAWPGLYKLHPAVNLANRLKAETEGVVTGQTFETQFFRRGNVTAEDQVKTAEGLKNQFRYGSMAVGLVAGLAVWGILRRRRPEPGDEDYHPDQAHCLACARCMDWCPEHHQAKAISRGKL